MEERFEGWDRDLRSFVERLVEFDTTDGRERPAQEFVRDRFEEWGFQVYEWTADAESLADHPSFPDDPTEIAVADRPSVAGVVEFGEPDAGPTLVLNGHVDVVPADRESWSGDPFEATWEGPDDAPTLRARGAADMKSGLGVCAFVARHLRDRQRRGEIDLDGRLVVESVVGEEEGGIGAAAAALSSPYPFDRDAALVSEPTELRAVTATEGSVMKRLRIRGRSAHAATRWRGESVLPHFHRIHDAFFELERERARDVSHPLYEDFEVPWPITFGRVEAGTWGSSVPAGLVAQIRIGVAPGESVDEVERVYEDRLADLVADDGWLRDHPPEFERFSIQFEPAEIDAGEPVVEALQAALRAHGMDADPTGATYGADARHYVAAGIPTVVFGPGSIEQAHFPDERIRWSEVLTAGDVIADACERFLAG